MTLGLFQTLRQVDLLAQFQKFAFRLLAFMKRIVPQSFDPFTWRDGSCFGLRDGTSAGQKNRAGDDGCLQKDCVVTQSEQCSWSKIWAD